VKEIPLNNGMFALVDDEDFAEISKWSWTAVEDRNTYYAVTSVRGSKPRSRRLIKMHRMILGCVPFDGVYVDHEDGNGLNNQRFNITKTTNTINVRKQHTVRAQSGAMGVTAYRDKWTASVTRYRKHVHIGIFDSVEDASQARQMFIYIEDALGLGREDYA